MKHPERIIENETPFETGERSTYLRYDAYEQSLRGQVKGLSDQVVKDGGINHKKLEILGNEAVTKLEEAAEIIAKMWRISEPYNVKGSK